MSQDHLGKLQFIFWDGIPLDNSQMKDGLLIEILTRVNLMEGLTWSGNIWISYERAEYTWEGIRPQGHSQRYKRDRDRPLIISDASSVCQPNWCNNEVTLVVLVYSPSCISIYGPFQSNGCSSHITETYTRVSQDISCNLGDFRFDIAFNKSERHRIWCNTGHIRGAPVFHLRLLMSVIKKRSMAYIRCSPVTVRT